jgi:hypothetical protein
LTAEEYYYLANLLFNDNITINQPRITSTTTTGVNNNAPSCTAFCGSPDENGITTTT